MANVVHVVSVNFFHSQTLVTLVIYKTNNKNISPYVSQYVTPHNNNNNIIDFCSFLNISCRILAVQQRSFKGDISAQPIVD
jgi:hypothetical protein